MRFNLFNPAILRGQIQEYKFDPKEYVPQHLRDQFRVEVRWKSISIIRIEDDREIRLSRGNGVYVQDMAACFDYYFSSVAPTAGGRANPNRRVVDFSHPHDQKVVGFNDFPVHCPSLAEPYITCQQYLDFAQLVPGSTSIDLGAYSGLTSITFSKVAGAAGRVLAVEPDRTNQASCAINIERHARINKLSNIELFPIAIAGRSGRIQFSNEGAMGSAPSSIVGTHRGSVTSVECKTLDELATSTGVGRVDFVKMDIEGAEVETVAAAGEFFRRFRPRIIVETHAIKDGTSLEPVRTALESFGYDCKVIEQYGVAVPLLTAVPPVSRNSP
jgi:FkbM family methyltransferase